MSHGGKRKGAGRKKGYSPGRRAGSRSVPITIQVTDAEFDALDALATERGSFVATVAHECVAMSSALATLCPQLRAEYRPNRVTIYFTALEAELLSKGDKFLHGFTRAEYVHAHVVRGLELCAHT